MNKELNIGVIAGVVSLILFFCTTFLWETISTKITIAELVELCFKTTFSLIFMVIFLIAYHLIERRS